MRQEKIFIKADDRPRAYDTNWLLQNCDIQCDTSDFFSCFLNDFFFFFTKKFKHLIRAKLIQCPDRNEFQESLARLERSSVSTIMIILR